jgi:ADP-ribosylglycohydrolase
MVVLSEAQYRDKVLGGWLGKLIGAALGSPVEGQKQAQESVGDPETLKGGRPRPQEGLALELISLRALAQAGAQPSSDDLVSAWLRHLRVPEHEYGHALANFHRGVEPPLSGVFDNPFREALGAMARADLWGLVAPGDPEVAAALARQDALLDHSGTGVEAAILVAVAVSAAFVETDAARLLELALRFLPQESRVGRAVRDVSRWHGELADWRRTREMLLRAYGSEDPRDSVVAAGFLALGLLDGGGQFARTLTTTARCGWSATTTCGAAGAIIGTQLGGEGIPREWQEVVALDVETGAALVGLQTTAGLSALVSETCDLGRMVMRAQSLGRVDLVEEVPDTASSALAVGETGEFVRELLMGSYISHRRRGDLGIYTDYDSPPTIGYEAPRRLTITVANLGTRRVDIRTRIGGPAGFVITTNSDLISLPEGGNVSFSATISAQQGQALVGPVNPFTLHVSVESGPEFAAPITLVGAALWYGSGPYGDFEQSHPPESPAILSGETALGGEGWQVMSVAEPAVNLTAGLAGERGTYYLASDVLAGRARRARLRIACNDGTKVWCNGQEVWQQHEHRPADGRVSGDEFAVDLREGWNRLVIKMAQCSPRRFLSAVLKDADGYLLLDVANTRPRPA